MNELHFLIINLVSEKTLKTTLKNILRNHCKKFIVYEFVF